MKRRQYSANLQICPQKLNVNGRNTEKIKSRQKVNPSEEMFKKKKYNVYHKTHNIYQQQDPKRESCTSPQLPKSQIFSKGQFYQNGIQDYDDIRERRQRSMIMEQVRYENGKQKEEKPYKQIFKLMEQENINLKQQNNYLLKVISKQRKKSKNQTILLQRRIFQLQKQLQITKKHLEFLQILNLEDKKTVNQRKEDQILISPESRNTIPAFLLNISDTATDTIETNSYDLNYLNEKFQNIYAKYSENKDPQLRKHCVELAKKIKELKQPKNHRNSEKRSKSKGHRRTFTGDHTQKCQYNL